VEECFNILFDSRYNIPSSFGGDGVDKSHRQIEAAHEIPDMPLGRAIFRLVIGLIVLIASSRILVWGAAIGYGFRGSGRISRLSGASLLAGYIGYNTYLVVSVFNICRPATLIITIPGPLFNSR
jgi:hypothetical protein